MNVPVTIEGPLWVIALLVFEIFSAGYFIGRVVG